MRYVTLAPSGIPHRTLEDTQFMGYDIPKVRPQSVRSDRFNNEFSFHSQNSFVITSLYASHKDPTVWEQPDLFKPERFLDQNGKLCLSKDRSLPFGAGKRLCAGETFARNTMFMFVTAIMQSFTVKPADWETIPSIEDTETGIIVYTKNCWLQLEPRQ